MVWLNSLQTCQWRGFKGGGRGVEGEGRWRRLCDPHHNLWLTRRGGDSVSDSPPEDRPVLTTTRTAPCYQKSNLHQDTGKTTRSFCLRLVYNVKKNGWDKVSWHLLFNFKVNWRKFSSRWNTAASLSSCRQQLTDGEQDLIVLVNKAQLKYGQILLNFKKVSYVNEVSLKLP